MLVLIIDEDSGANADRLAARLQNDIERQDPVSDSSAAADTADFGEAVSGVLRQPPFDPSVDTRKGWWDRTIGT